MRLVDSPLRARRGVQVRGERLGQPVGERLDEDRAVVVVRALEPSRQFLGAEARVTANAPM